MHRDIKPSNIMIDRILRRLAFIDFGYTKEISPDSRCDSMTPGQGCSQDVSLRGVSGRAKRVSYAGTFLGEQS